jgi:hypothetical protein
MRRDRSPRVHAMVAGGVGGVLAALGHGWLWNVPLWEPYRLCLAIVVGAGTGLLCERVLPPSDP